MKRIIATIAVAILGAILSIPVWLYGHYKELKNIKNPYTGNIFVFILLGASLGALIMIFWFSNDDKKN